MKRRQVGAVLLIGIGAATGAVAQSHPIKPIRVIVGYAAGGAVAIIARAIALAPQLGQPVIVDNKSGAGTNLATRARIERRADGYTVMLAANTSVANVSLYQPPPDDIGRAITPIAPVGRVAVVIPVNAPSDFKTTGQLVAAAIAQP